MLIPKQIAALGKVVGQNPSRYALNAIRIERQNGRPRALATDGHRGILFTWEEPDSADYPPVDGLSAKPIAGFAANVCPRALADAAKGTPGRSFQPILDYVLLDESDNKTIRLASTTLDRVTRAEALADEGAFPPVDQVVPQPGRDKMVYDPVRHGDAPFTHVRITVNATLMAQTLTAMASLASDGDHNPVTLTVPVSPSRPIRLDARTSDRRAVGVVMPVALAQQLDEEPQTQTEAAPTVPPAEAPAQPTEPAEALAA